MYAEVFLCISPGTSLSCVVCIQLETFSVESSVILIKRLLLFMENMKKKSHKAECRLGVTQHCACKRGSWQESVLSHILSFSPITADNLSSKSLCQLASTRFSTWPTMFQRWEELFGIWSQKILFDWSSSGSPCLVYFVSDLYKHTRFQTLLLGGGECTCQTKLKFCISWKVSVLPWRPL